MSLTLEQERARFALEKIQGVRGMPAGERDKYKSQLLKLPARLHTNGLGQTVAFYLSAGSGKPEWKICEWLGEWLGTRQLHAGARLIDTLTTRSADDYRRAAAETRALAVWLKRFAEAFLEAAPAIQTAGQPEAAAGGSQ
jgi:CRISPR-associated protein Cmr5